MGKLALAAKITHVPSMYLSELDGPRITGPSTWLKMLTVFMISPRVSAIHHQSTTPHISESRPCTGEANP